MYEYFYSADCILIRHILKYLPLTLLLVHWHILAVRNFYFWDAIVEGENQALSQTARKAFQATHGRLWWNGLFVWKAAPEFPISHLPLSCHGKSPTFPMAKTKLMSFILKLSPLEPMPSPVGWVPVTPTWPRALGQEGAQEWMGRVQVTSERLWGEEAVFSPGNILAWFWARSGAFSK